MKIGTRFDLRKPGASSFVQDIIDNYGISRDVNCVGLAIKCRDDNGNLFELVQLNSSRHIVAVCGCDE